MKKYQERKVILRFLAAAVSVFTLLWGGSYGTTRI